MTGIEDLFIVICKYTVAVFRHSRRGHQISLWVVVVNVRKAEKYCPGGTGILNLKKIIVMYVFQ